MIWVLCYVSCVCVYGCGWSIHSGMCVCGYIRFILGESFKMRVSEYMFCECRGRVVCVCVCVCGCVGCGGL